MVSIFENLINIVRKRKSKPVLGSYTNKLLTDKIFTDKWKTYSIRYTSTDKNVNEQKVEKTNV